jgi:hypothetical protein
MEILEGDCEPLDIPEESLEDENDDIEDDTLFHDAGPIEHAEKCRLEIGWCMHLNYGILAKKLIEPRNNQTCQTMWAYFTSIIKTSNLVYK